MLSKGQMASDLRRLIFGIVLAVVPCRQHLLAGDIKGKVILREPVSDNSVIVSRELIRRFVSKRPDNYQRRAEKPGIVVYLVGLKKGTKENAEKSMLLDQKNETFVPHVLPVPLGTRVRFLNSDDVYHNVFSFSPAKTFDLGRYKKGKTRSVMFDKPGIVKVYCDIHTHMNAFILVLENPYFSLTRDNGSFEIKDIPAGSYVLKAWHGRGPEKAQAVVVEETGVQHINFEFP